MACLVLCTLTVLFAQAAAHGFPLKPQWAASISGNNAGSNIVGTFAWDSVAGHTRLEAQWNFSSMFAEQGLEDAMGFACSLKDKHYCTSTFRKDCFRWLMRSRTESLVQLLWGLYEDSTRDGDCSAYSADIVNATDAQLWSVQREGIGNLSMCVTSDGLPLGLISFPDKNYVGPSNVDASTYRWLFHNVTLGPQSIKEPTCPECPAVSPCSGEGGISMEVLRLTYGEGEPWGQIWNLMTGDVAGEMMFDHDFSRPYLKVFNVTVNSSWGPGRDCNFENGENRISPPREPSFSKLVARKGAEGFEHPCGGQCPKNELGSWYAFPKEGSCQKDVPIGTDGCTWRVESVKVVSTDCVKSVGKFVAACGKDKGNPPWPDAQAAIRKGIAECPDIRSLRR